MTKVVYNNCYGGFGLSNKAVQRYSDLTGLGLTHHKSYLLGHWELPNGIYWYDTDLSRSDPILIQIVEELGEEANGNYAKLAFRELEPGTKYRIDEYDGMESVMTIDDYEWSIA